MIEVQIHKFSFFLSIGPVFRTVLRTFKGPFFGCDCGIKCCELLLKQLCSKFEIAEWLFNGS